MRTEQLRNWLRSLRRDDDIGARLPGDLRGDMPGIALPGEHTHFPGCAPSDAGFALEAPDFHVAPGSGAKG